MDAEMAEFKKWRRRQKQMLVGMGSLAVIAVGVATWATLRARAAEEINRESAADNRDVAEFVRSWRPVHQKPRPTVQPLPPIDLPLNLDRFGFDAEVKGISAYAEIVANRAVFAALYGGIETGIGCVEVFMNNDSFIVGMRASFYQAEGNPPLRELDEWSFRNLVNERVFKRYLGATWRDDLLPAVPQFAGKRIDATFDYRGHWVDVSRLKNQAGIVILTITIRSKHEWAE